MTRLHQAAIVAHSSVGRGYYRLVLKAPDIAASAVPGQFVMLRVTENGDPFLARPFGIASVSAGKTIELFYRVAGRGTTLLTGGEAGQKLSTLGPLGKGFPLPEKDIIPLLVAGGSGFPPLHFLSLRAGARAHLFIGARNRECLPPVSVLKSFRDQVQRVHVATENGSAGLRGMATEALEAFLAKRDRNGPFTIYACGPRAMLAAVSAIAAEHSIPCFVSAEERMACGLGACMGCSIPMKTGGYQRVCKEGPVFDSRELAWPEQTFPLVNR